MSRSWAVFCCCMLVVGGCSAETKQETKEALQATGEAAGAAAEDAKVNLKKAGEVVRAAGKEAKDEFSTAPDEPPGAVPGDDADADTVPEAQEKP